MTVPNIAYPQAADINQSRNVISYRIIKMAQSNRDRHRKTLREFEIIKTNSITQAFDPACKRSVREHKLPHFPNPQLCRGGS
jgi:hypothetical protein